MFKIILLNTLKLMISLIGSLMCTSRINLFLLNKGLINLKFIIRILITIYYSGSWVGERKLFCKFKITINSVPVLLPLCCMYFYVLIVYTDISLITIFCILNILKYQILYNLIYYLTSGQFVFWWKRGVYGISVWLHTLYGYLFNSHFTKIWVVLWPLNIS
jgi:hypothetical protein